MASLVSPGLSITIIDDSQYISSGVGTVPFVLMATAQDKTFQGSSAAYTSKANAGQLLAVTSQRDLITSFGYPSFQLSSAGTPLNGYETNEYGLMAAYSAMGVCNKMFVIRADIDLAQLEGTAVRPIGSPANGLYWLDTATTAWGIYEWNTVTQSFTNRVPTIITDTTQVTVIANIPTPLQSVGSIGSYAVVVSDATNAITMPILFYKGPDNNWVQIGSTAWQNDWVTVAGTASFAIASPITAASTIVINGSPVNFTNGASLTNVVGAINSAAITGVTAAAVNNMVALYATSAATNGKIVIAVGSPDAALMLGLTPGTYAAPTTQYGSYVSVPDWRETDTTPRPTGSVWFKTSTLGNGANLVLNQFNADNDAWEPIATPIYANDAAALYALDPLGGGNNIVAGTVYVDQDALDNGTGSYRPMYRQTQGGLKVVGSNTVFTNSSFTALNTFTVSATVPGSATFPAATTVTIPSALLTYDASSFVNALLAANIPNVTAAIEASGAISISHTAGGSIILGTGTGSPLTTAGFTSSTVGLRAVTPGLLASNFALLTYTYSDATPYTSPKDGTLWFYNSPLDVDILINETTGWKGYRNVSGDARGYNLVNTDPNGPILSPTEPTVHSNGVTAIVPGELWINTGDLVNFPVISRYTGTTWELIDNADQINQNGILFADARWDSTGTTDPLSGDFPLISALALSNYVDLDCPDHRLYPRGTLLFNLRRSGYNVKHYVSDYFNAQSFPDNTLPAEAATWVTSSGLKNDGSPYMGAAAQRSMVVKALKAAIDGSETLREESFQFNLVCCPGYPELISDMVELNNDRKNTAFIIGDTPMHLKANPIDVTNWSTNANGDGLSVADPYMAVYYPSGQTTDLQGNAIIVPPSHMILRAAIKSDSVSYPWFAYAGTRRGLVDNCTDIGYIDEATGEFSRNGINQGMRDTLYPLAINPVTLLPGVGITIFGNKTRIGTASSLDRVNVARLVNYVRTILSSVGNAYLFEPDDKTTWDAIGQVISSAMNDLVTKRGIYNYAVVCDSSNNTPDRIANNELYVDIAIEPEKDVEFIYIPIRLMNPGAIAGGAK